MSLRVPPLFLALACLAAPGCQTGVQGPPPSGPVQPTVAGAAPPSFAGLAAARQAFTRVMGSLTVTLEDSAWLRFEGTPDSVEAAHRAYFEYGYTTFQVELRSRTFTQPTAEVFLLEDGQGTRLEGRPISYEGSPMLVDDRYFSTFTISFPHTVTAATGWIRLTRLADDSAVTWTFGADLPPPCGSPGGGSPPP